MPNPFPMKVGPTAAAILVASFFGLYSCSFNRLAMNKVANALTAPGGGTVFTGDNDPELVGDALPFAIKMYESLMVSVPRHSGLRLQTGSLYVMYANAFLQTPAVMLGEAEFQKQEFTYGRAKNLYLRGRDILLADLDRRHPGFRKALNDRKYRQALASMRKEDVPFLYWAGAGWLGAFAINPFDMKIGVAVPQAAAMMDRVLELDEGYGQGAIHDFYVLYYGSLPDYMGGSPQKARDHFEKAIRLALGKAASPYLSLATTVSVKEQNLEEFRRLLGKALEVDPEADPENRLATILNQRKARWLLEHAEDYFVDAEDSSGQAVQKEKKETP